MILALVYASDSGFAARYDKMPGETTGRPVINRYSAHK